jgi:hypothetical protein
MLTRAGEVLYIALPEGPVTGGWGQWYESRSGGAPYQHRGLDIGNYGNPYRAGTWGRVVPFTNNGNFGGYGAYGLGVCIDHGRGRFRYTLFAHNSRLLANVGDVVGPDTLIAVSGATGDVQGGHIHIQRQVDTRFSTDIADSADPLQFLATPKDKEQPMTPAERGLINIAWGDFGRALAVYRALRRAPTPANIRALLPEEGLEAALQNADPRDDLNAALMLRGRLTALATSDVADAAYRAVGGTP